MIDLLLINPAASREVYGPLNDEFVAIEPPLWLRLIAGYVRDRGFSVMILDAEAEQQGHHEVGQIARDIRPRLACIVAMGHQPSASTQSMVGASKVARAIKSQYDCALIIVGGHPSALPERTLHDEVVDYVAVGEGPATIMAMLQQPLLGPGVAISNIESIPGLAFRFRDEVRINPRAPLIEDLRELHGHVWDRLPMRRYKSHTWQSFGDLSKRQPYASIYTSLNCPWACHFCCISAPFGGKRYQMRRPDDVVDEIEYLHEEHGVSTLKITDEMFVLNRRHYTAICEGVIRRGLGSKLNIWAYARVDTVEPDTLDMLRAAGIQWLALGIESASKHVRDGAQKKLRTEDIVGTVRTIQSHGIRVIGNFMFGLKDDSSETMQQTLDLALECMPDFGNFYSVQAYPGSALYDEAIAKGWTLPETWSGYSQHNEDTRPLDTEHLTGAEVLAFRDAAFTRFFTDDRYRAHVADKFGADTLAHVEKMVGYKLRRKLLEGEARENA